MAPLVPALSHVWLYPATSILQDIRLSGCHFTHCWLVVVEVFFDKFLDAVDLGKNLIHQIQSGSFRGLSLNSQFGVRSG